MFSWLSCTLWQTQPSSWRFLGCWAWCGSASWTCRWWRTGEPQLQTTLACWEEPETHDVRTDNKSKKSTCCFTRVLPWRVAVVVTFLPSDVVSWNGSFRRNSTSEFLNVDWVMILIFPSPELLLMAVGVSPQATYDQRCWHDLQL